MVLDVEGVELQVIEGMADPLPRVMAVEVYFSGLDNVSAALARLGYRHDYTHHDDAVFVR
jgi:hypothetical protein